MIRIYYNYKGTDYYYLRNGQGDIVKLIDGSGSTVVEYSYNSWGEQTGCVGTLSTALGILNPFRCRGYVYDEETGLYYLQSRYYDPDLCRFMSADVFLSTGQGVLGCNAFAYCLNNPVNCIDENGTDVDWVKVENGLLVVGLLAAATAVTILAIVGTPFTGGMSAAGGAVAASALASSAIAVAESALVVSAASVASAATIKTVRTTSSKGNNRDYKTENKTPRNNKAQNKQVQDIVRKVKLDKKQQRTLHDMITGQGFSYHEIMELALLIKGD